MNVARQQVDHRNSHIFGKLKVTFNSCQLSHCRPPHHCDWFVVYVGAFQID